MDSVVTFNSQRIGEEEELAFVEGAAFLEKLKTVKSDACKSRVKVIYKKEQEEETEPSI